MLIPDRRWFATESFEGNRGGAMLAVAKDLQNDQEEQTRQDLMLAHGRMFEQAPIKSLQCYAGSYSRGTSYRFDVNDAATWNVARSVILTAATIIGASQPRIRLLTNDGSFGQKRRARKASLWYSGWADEADLAAVTFECLVDSMVFDLGVLQVYEQGGEVKVQRILPFEILVDAKAAMYGLPRGIYRRRHIDKDVVFYQLAKGKKISADQRELLRTAPTEDDTNDRLVWEAWHLPSGPGAKDGRHIIAVEVGGALDGGVTLVDEPYEKDYYPLVFWRYEKARAGFYGMSLMRQLEPIQVAINILLAKIEKAQRLMCVPRVAIPKGSKIVEGQLTNKIAGAIEYAGNNPPQALVWPALPREVYDQLQRHEDHGYALPGISRNISRGEKDAGLTAAVAIRESLDIQQGRMRKPQQMNERAHVEVAKVVLDMVADIAADKGYVVHAPGALGMLEPMDWKKLGLDRRGYKVGLYPTSNLPLTPAGRLEYVQEMLKAGLYDQERATAAMDELDPDSENGLESSPVRLLEYQFEEMLYEGKPQMPDDFTPYATALKLGTKYLGRGRVEKAPAKNIDLVRRFLRTCKEQDNKLKAAAAPPPAPVDAAGSGPGGMAPAEMPPEAMPVAA